MTTFRIILAIISFIGIFAIANQMDKRWPNNDAFNAICVGGIACCSIILGLCLGLLLA